MNGVASFQKIIHFLRYTVPAWQAASVIIEINVIDPICILFLSDGADCHRQKDFPSDLKVTFDDDRQIQARLFQLFDIISISGRSKSQRLLFIHRL